MKKLLLVPVLLMFMGCMGVMNEYDRDAAKAHYEAQKEALTVWDAQNSKPLCRFEFDETKPVTGLKTIECNAPVSFAGLPSLSQYTQPEHPAKEIAQGVKSLLTQAPMALLGMFGFKQLGNAAKNAGGNTTTTYNQSVAGAGNSASLRTMGNIQTGNVIGKGNQFGIIDNTSTPTVVHTQVVPVEPVIVYPTTP